jgi:hypothetical protein
MRHTQHPDSLGVRLHCGSYRKACKGEWRGYNRGMALEIKHFLVIKLEFKKSKMKRQETVENTSNDPSYSRDMSKFSNTLS